MILQGLRIPCPPPPHTHTHTHAHAVRELKIRFRKNNPFIQFMVPLKRKSQGRSNLNGLKGKSNCWHLTLVSRINTTFESFKARKSLIFEIEIPCSIELSIKKDYTYRLGCCSMHLVTCQFKARRIIAGITNVLLEVFASCFSPISVIDIACAVPYAAF